MTTAARREAIERTGWGNGFSLWQPRNACFWVYAGVVGYGCWYAYDLVDSQVRVYWPALATSSLIFAAYGLLLWWFTARIDRYSRQPRGLVIAGFVWGGLGATWTIAVHANTSMLHLYQKLVSQEFSLDWGAGLTAPVFEELGKGSGVLLLMFLAPSVVRTAYDGFILGAFTGLGFEIVEDVLYALRSAPDEFGSHQLASSLHTDALRLLTGFSSHILYSAVFCAGLVYLLGTPGQRRRPVLGPVLMLTAMVLHFLWDSTTVLSGGDGLVVIVLMVVIALAAIAIVIAVFHVAVRPERDAMRAVMQPEVDTGVLTPAELDALAGGWRQRRRYRAGGGRRDRRRRRHRLATAHDLADQIAAAGGHDTSRVRVTRAELARLALSSREGP
ncbi:PrsW family intramembrane metalloprotease [Dactylosporangium sp. CA-052675]|uniref:PrsW family intramembrane metalloprotease n=1 Tax=Dactylosporangium sp. CA-052675 TaxID=3239927 RepID=UPI003D8BB1D7